MPNKQQPQQAGVFDNANQGGILGGISQYGTILRNPYSAPNQNETGLLGMMQGIGKLRSAFKDPYAQEREQWKKMMMMNQGGNNARTF